MDLTEMSLKNNRRHPWELARQTIVIKLISKHILKTNKKINVLDVGSGDAFLASSFTQLQNIDNVYAIDTAYTTKFINETQEKYKTPKLSLHQNLKTLKKDKINLITLLDVIEHVPDDTAFLKSIIKQTTIEKNALVLITVPAYQALFSKHDILLKHYRRYNLKQLKKVVNDCNLEFINGGYFFSSLLIPRLVALIFEKLKIIKQQKNLGQWHGSKTLTVILKNILLFDFKVAQLLKVFKIYCPGLSCYAVCKITKPLNLNGK